MVHSTADRNLRRKSLHPSVLCADIPIWRTRMHDHFRALSPFFLGYFSNSNLVQHGTIFFLESLNRYALYFVQKKKLACVSRECYYRFQRWQMLAKAKIEAGFSGRSIAGLWVQDSESMFAILEKLYSLHVLCTCHFLEFLQNIHTNIYSLLCNLNCLTCQIKLACFRPCLDAFKISKLYKMSHHIESLNACMK